VRDYVAAAGEDLLMVAASILLVEPLLTTEPGWWSFIVALPLFAWSVLLRVRVGRERQLNREPVTGWLNRSGLEARVREFTLYDRVRGDRAERFGIVLLNVDELATINRTLGWEAYDDIVARIAARLSGAYPPRSVGRLGGEGAVVVIPGMTEESAIEHAEAAVALLAEPVEVRGVPFYLEPAAGVAMSPEHGRDFGRLLAKAAFAVREARRQGMTATLYRRSATDEANRRLEILLELKAALTDPARANEVSVLYQPQVQVDGRRLTGVEALVRWTHPRWGPVRPDEFVDAIEATAVMNLLTLRVLETAIRQLRQWNDRGLQTRVAVNVSVRDLHEPEFVDQIAALIERYGIATRQLTIEVTERMVISADPLVARAAERISRLGVGLSLDDFGVGFASLYQLRTLPLTEVKIDRSYVAKVATSAEQWAIVKTLHGLAEALRLEMVAEGVEDEQTAACLSRLPGMIGQGYLFGKPMTVQALDGWHATSQLRSPRTAAHSIRGTKPMPS
jgi:diguanylate cyclase (GGDEF)-like protein